MKLPYPISACVSSLTLRAENHSIQTIQFTAKMNLPSAVNCRCQMVALCYLSLMGQPVKVSDALLLDARLAAGIVERSIAGQIEFWAGLGRAIEPLLQGHQVLALCQAGAATPLSERLQTVDTPAGRQRVATHLAAQPFPHYAPAPEAPGLLVRVDADGRRTLGRFVNRQFQTVKPAKK